MIILSFDAMGGRDLQYMKQQPNFQKIYEGSARCEKVFSVYPSITYPTHASIVTGKYPRSHKVVNNSLIQPGRIFPDWMWQRKYIHGTTFYDEAIKKGKKVAALLWPVTAKSKIQYNLPEVVALRPWQNQIVVSALNGSMFYEIDLARRFGKCIKGIQQPELDNFVQLSLLYTLKKYRPDLTMVHFTDLDTTRHRKGLDNENTYQAMDRHDKRLGEIMELLQKEGMEEETTIVLLGDHSQMDVHTIVNLNALLAKRGYVKVRNKKIIGYRALAKHCDGSCYIYIKDPSIVPQVADLLKEWKKKGCYGIEKIWNRKQVRELGADDRCSFMVEAKEGYYFLDGVDSPVKRVEEEKDHPMKATHGYLPYKEGYETFFMMKGPGVKENVHVEKMTLVDEGPTIAKLLSLNLKGADGRVVEEMLV